MNGEVICFSQFWEIVFFPSYFLGISQDFLIEMQERSFFVKSSRICRWSNLTFVFSFSAHKIRSTEENLTE